MPFTERPGDCAGRDGTAWRHAPGGPAIGRRRSVTLGPVCDGFCEGEVLGSDEGHQQFVCADQRHGGPGADQGTDGAVSHAVCQVGADGGHDADAEAPLGQRWYRLVPAVGVEDHH
jgi:hypothetical protein